MNSPFQIGGTAIRLSGSERPHKRVLVRLGDADITNTVVIRIASKVPTDSETEDVAAADNANVYLKGGEAYEISACSIPDGDVSTISLLNTSGDPLVYVSIE